MPMPSPDSSDKQPPRKATRARRKTVRAPYAPSTPVAAEDSSTASARELYQREKARRVGHQRPKDHPLEQARRAYEALLAKDAERTKGGRPKKTATSKSAETVDED
jgi:hypothetical protein